MENRKKIRGLIDKFLTILKAQNKDHTSTVSREELHGALAEVSVKIGMSHSFREHITVENIL